MVAQMKIKISQSIAAVDLRWSDMFFRSLSVNATIKELFKLAYICQSYSKIKVARFYGPLCICIQVILRFRR